MLEKILRRGEKLIPKKIYEMGQPFYHFFLAILGMLIYNFPAKKMTIIAVTGTKGKTSTVNFIHSVLNQNGHKAGLISTANIKIGEQEKINQSNMSMLGRFFLQKILKEMYLANCKYVILEVTSQGIKQWRHLGLFIDVAVLTNLSPEHLASHNNSFEKYIQTKMRIFKNDIFNKLKLILLNSDDEHVVRGNPKNKKTVEVVDFSLQQVSNISENLNGVTFDLAGQNYQINILGKFNIYNALPAIILGQKFGLTDWQIKNGLAKLNLIPGRMEEIKSGQNFRVIIDYAHEKLSINTLLDTARNLKNNLENKILIVLGGDGGGRDGQRLIDLGQAVGQKADIIAITNSDPYFDDQNFLANSIQNSALAENNFRQENNLEILENNKNIFVILDREEGIKKIFSLAKEGDIVLLTTRGSLETMNIMGKKVKSNDKEIVQRILSVKD